MMQFHKPNVPCVKRVLITVALLPALAFWTLPAQAQEEAGSKMTMWLAMQDASLRLTYYNVNSTRTRVIEAGTGKPVILLHGGGGTGEGFIPNLIGLSEKYHVYIVQMLGHGFTDGRPGIDYTVADLSEHVKEFMDEAGIERANLVGVSLGGWVAAWLAYKYPERVDRLVLHASDGLVGWSDAIAENVRLVQSALANPTADNMRKRRQYLQREEKEARGPVRSEEQEQGRVRIYSRPSVQEALGILFKKGLPISYEQYLLTPERLRNIKARTLFLWSSNDPTCPWQTAEQASKHVPDPKFVVVKSEGHGIQIEQPATFNRIVGDFLSD